jgi:predicted transcriptional regulator
MEMPYERIKEDKNITEGIEKRCKQAIRNLVTLGESIVCIVGKSALGDFAITEKNPLKWQLNIIEGRMSIDLNQLISLDDYHISLVDPFEVFNHNKFCHLKFVVELRQKITPYVYVTPTIVGAKQVLLSIKISNPNVISQIADNDFIFDGSDYVRSKRPQQVSEYLTKIVKEIADLIAVANSKKKNTKPISKELEKLISEKALLEASLEIVRQDKAVSLLTAIESNKNYDFAELSKGLQTIILEMQIDRDFITEAITELKVTELAQDNSRIYPVSLSGSVTHTGNYSSAKLLAKNVCFETKKVTFSLNEKQVFSTFSYSSQNGK